MKKNSKISEVLIKNFKKNKIFKFIEQDIFNVQDKYHNLFDVVRVSNLLNYSYFSEVELRKAIININKTQKKMLLF